MTTTTAPKTKPLSNQLLAGLPSDTWELDQLGQYVQHLGRKSAETAWRLGAALKIAKSKVKHGQWGPWCKQHCPFLDKTTIWRYMQVADLSEADVTGAKVTDAYEMLFGSKSGAKGGGTPVVVEGGDPVERVFKAWLPRMAGAVADLAEAMGIPAPSKEQVREILVRVVRESAPEARTAA